VRPTSPATPRPAATGTTKHRGNYGF
jgi:hypothetical protein